jgi:DNA-binding transcriptional regulator YdaS (Cro superfamily)
MEDQTPLSSQLALQRAIDVAGGKTSLMRQLNERGRAITSHNTIAQWLKNRTPSDYCPDIEALTGVRCEDLRPDVAWDVLRMQAAPAEMAEPARSGI